MQGGNRGEGGGGERRGGPRRTGAAGKQRAGPAGAACEAGAGDAHGNAAHARFFLKELQDGLTAKEVNDLWLKYDDAQRAQTFTVDFMRDGLQFWEKHGRKLQGIPSNKARSTWQQMTWQAKTMWGAKANIRNKVECACMLGASGDLADLSG